jgi:beta-lactam-binding protein with PASTA domain
MARRRLVASHCRVGKVRYVFSKRAKRGLVISQKPLLGAVRPKDAKVSLVVSRGHLSH